MPSLAPQKRIGTWLLVISAGAWLALAALGQRALLNYDNAAVIPGAPPAKWPTASKIPHSPGLPAIVVVAHPRCPCTRATIEELAKLMTRVHDRATATVIFVRPHGFAPDWEKTDLWTSAARIPGVTALSDPDGVEASLFGGQASGQTMLYSVTGDLQFSGGITVSRGHAGDNLGRSAIVSLIINGISATNHTSVFGCSLHNSERAVFP